MAEAVSRVAARTAGKEAAAVEAFAVALRRLPSAVADNAGYDSADLISRLRAHHAQGELTMGLGELFFVNWNFNEFKTNRPCRFCLRAKFN